MPSRRPRALAGLLSAALAAASVALVGGAAPAAAAAPCSTTLFGDCISIFEPTSTPDQTQTWTVPAGVTTVTVDVRGASGSSAVDYGRTVDGGSGGIVRASFAVTPGTTVYVAVGTSGGTKELGEDRAGGGGSFVFYGADTHVIAGGGGAANLDPVVFRAGKGGAGGGAGTAAGVAADPGERGFGEGGAAATGAAAGGNGTGPASFQDGTIRPGRGGSDADSSYDSPGGDGWYGGGGASGGGGGGGSGHVSNAKVIDTAAGGSSGDGAVYLTWKAGPTVTTSSLPKATYGSSYSAQLAASGGTAPYTWEATSSVPMWLGLSQDGALSGTPTSPSSVKTITVKATDARGVASAPVTLDLNVDKQQQMLSFATSPSSTRVGESWSPTFAATPPTQVVPMLVATDSGCKVDGDKVVFVKVGRCTLSATLPATDTTTAAQAPERVAMVGKGAQSITFTSTPPSAARIGGSYTPTATSPAGAVTFAASGACEKRLSEVEMTSTGTCTVTADQAGSDDYDVAPTATQTFTVGKALQTVRIDSAAPTTAQVGGASYAVSISSSTENAVSIVVDPSTTNAACSVSRFTVTFRHAGTCALQAVAAGSARYEQGTSPVQSFTVDKGSFSPDWEVPTGLVVGDSWVPQVIGVPAGAGAPTVVVDSKASNGACVVSPTVAGMVLMRHAGRCLARVDYAPSADWNASTAGPISSTVGKGAQTITWAGAPTSGAVGDVVALSASSSSGLPVAYAAEGGCSVSGTALSLTRVGDCVVTATQAGDGDFTAAPSVRHTVAVSAAPVAAAPAVRDPRITATVTSRKPVSASGWYRRAVTVTFTCTAGSAALKAACPAPVRIGRASTARTITRTVTALDGGTATVTVGPLNVDRVAPQVRIVQRDGRAPVCRATDRRSGVALCTLRTITTARGVVLVAKAVDRAGNRAVRRVRVS